jgi:uncharacterized protein DUF5317
LIGLLLPSCVAVLATIAWRRGNVRLTGFQFQWWELAGIAFAIELLLYTPPLDSTPFALAYGQWAWVATRFLLLAAVLRNVRASRACLVMAIGIALNTLVIVANGGFMPQSTAAASAVWSSSITSSTHLENTRPMDGASRLTWLADVLPEPKWLPAANVLSVGDVILASGMAAWVFASASNRGGDTGSVVDVELGEDVLDMGFHRFHRNDELVGNRPI